MGDRELIEQARAIVEQGDRSGPRAEHATTIKTRNVLQALADRLEALAGPMEREGWVLVPKEPTLEMIEALDDGQEYDEGGYLGYSAKDAYAAMLSAAPKPSSLQRK
jgi:hypothetical protein